LVSELGYAGIQSRQAVRLLAKRRALRSDGFEPIPRGSELSLAFDEAARLLLQASLAGRERFDFVS